MLPRQRNRFGWHSERGSVTAELAIAMPAVSLIIGITLGAFALQVDRMKLVDVAATSARALARGETEESIRQLAAQMLAQQKGFNLKEWFAFSDSNNDLPLLQCVGHPSAINPDAILRIKALAEGWPIYDFRRARYLNRLLGPAVSRLAALATFFVPRKRR